MKKVIIIYLFCIISMFFLPVFLVEKYNVVNEENNIPKEDQNIKLKLLLSEQNQIIDISLDEYIMGVLVGEMPIDYEFEALKAQAVVARTYTLNKIINSYKTHENADICDDINHCQAYKTKEYALKCWDDDVENDKWNKIKNAVLETKNEVITYDGNLINAFFHANSAGITEDICNIWGHENIPYLKSVKTEGEEILIEKKFFSLEDINRILKEKYDNYIEIKQITMQNNNMKIQCIGNNEELQDLVIEKNSSGRVSKMKISNIELEGTEVRTLFDLRSTMFDIQFKEKSIIFNTKGYGHGIGLSQYGSNYMAKNGSDYKEIIMHYYIGTKITNL
ncbi:MAG: stage II sporulation protein D [Clostridia bacterium]|nr:stage II sporulation protein D [Clostridia bacterium]